MAASPRTRAVWFLAIAAVCTHLATSAAAQRGPATRIVSLVPPLTEILVDIGAAPQVIAADGSDAEHIISLRPDLVLIDRSQESLRESLMRARIDVFDYRQEHLDNFVRLYITLGSLTGHRAEAVTRLRAIESELSVIRSQVSGRRRPRTLLVTGDDAAGGVGFLHELIEAAGGTNVLSDIKRESVPVSVEMLAARAPEVIIDVGPGDPTDALKAAKTDRIFVLRGDDLRILGPRIADGVRALAQALHPDAF